MKKRFLSVLIAAGIVAAMFQVLLGSETVRSPVMDSLLSRGVETVKANSPAPTPTPPGVVLYVPLPESYPLVCRGGGSLVRHGEVGIGLVIGTPPVERDIAFVFTRGTKPAGTGPAPSEALNPGECSWVDRGMHAEEPNRVSQHIEEGSESLKEGGKLAEENRWYEGLQSEGRFWTFMVYNNGSGELIATSARPNVPPDEGIHVSPTARLPPNIEVIKSYPLVCRGGESLVMEFAPGARSISLKFTKGTKPAGEGLARGECSWVDRAMNADESSRLSQSVADGWESLKEGGTLPPENRWYDELHSPDKYWTFMFYNERRQLNVTSARRSG